MNWKTFEIQHEGITYKVNWWSKDYSITCTINNIQLNESCHIMYMCPKVYTENKLRKRVLEEAPNFIEAAKIINENKAYFLELEKEFSKLIFEQEKILEELKNKRSYLRKRFKENKLSQKEYQKEVKEIENKKFEITCRLDYFRDLAKKITNKQGVTSIIRNYLVPTEKDQNLLTT